MGAGVKGRPHAWTNVRKICARLKKHLFGGSTTVNKRDRQTPVDSPKQSHMLLLVCIDHREKRDTQFARKMLTGFFEHFQLPLLPVVY